MDDALYGLLCLAVGVAPFAFVGFIVWAVRGGTKAADPRLNQLEAELAQAKGEIFALGMRVHQMERWASGVRAVEAVPAVASVVQTPAAPSIATPAIAVSSASVESESERVGGSPGASVFPGTDPAPVVAGAALAPMDATAASDPALPVVPPPVVPPPVVPSPVVLPSSAGAPPPSSDWQPPEPQEEGGLERWLGVRGAAAAGAIVLAIAGAYFFEYSIEHRLISASMRVALGVLVGLGCLGISEWKRQEYSVLSSWLGGAGIAILYTASWASHAIYDLVPSWAAGIFMIAVTAACAAISSRRDSLPTAILGLMGGFVTPLALSSGEDRPVPLFSYLLLLDVGLLWLSYRKRWSSLAWLSLVGTALYQLGWLGVNMTSETGWIGIGVILVFGVLYGVYSTHRAQRPDETEEVAGEQRFLAAVSTLLPFLLALSFAGRDVLSDHLWVVGALVTVLSIGALVVARRAHAPFVALAAAAGSLGVIVVWMVSHTLDTPLSWELAATLVVLALVFHVALELDRGSMILAGAALVMVFGGAFVATIASLTVTSLTPFVALAVFFAVLAARQAELEGRGWIGMLSGFALAVSLFAIEYVAPTAEQHFYGALAMVLVALFQITALIPRAQDAKRDADHGSAIAALALGAMHILRTWDTSVTIELAGHLVLAILVLLAASRIAAPSYAAAALLVAGLGGSVAVFFRGAHDDAIVSLALMGVSVLLFAGWPAIAGARYRTNAWAWRAAAMAGPVFFFAMRQAWVRAFGTAEIGILPVSLAIVSLGALTLARSRGPTDDATRRTALAWPAAITAGFVTLAIPLQLSNEWITIGWALEGAAVLWLFRRIDHAGLKWLAALLFAAVATRLLVNPYVLGYYPRGDIRIANWIAYTYLIPAAAMIAGYFALAPIEADRLRPFEQTLYPSRGPHLSRTLFAGALATIFAWLNLAIIDWYASGPGLSIPTEHMPARDLTISIAWAVYALFMLGLGVWRQSSGLRWTSLALIIITCFKVFLYDLSHLHDLYRVAALVGLAMSLLLVSLLYQRFVFRKPPRVPARETPQ